MIETYLASQIKKATYELIDDRSRFYGEIKGLQGVWATGKTLKECKENLMSSLEGWFILSLRKNLPIPHFKIPRVKMTQRMHA